MILMMIMIMKMKMMKMNRKMNDDIDKNIIFEEIH